MELAAALAFLVVLVLIATDWMHRTVIAMVGAIVFVLAGVLGEEEAFAAVDLGTIGLLVGMMVIVAAVERTGVFEQLAIYALRMAKGRPLRVVLTVSLFTAVTSAFLDNLTSILLVAPIAIAIAGRLGMAPAPLLILAVLASNIGGTATLVGDPPNIMIASHTGLSFNAFLVNLAPVAALTFVVVVAGIYLLNRKAFAVRTPGEVGDLIADVTLVSGRELWWPLGVLAVTLLGFFAHSALHLEPATVALAGASLLLVGSSHDIDRLLGAVDWPTLFFFAALFVMVGGLEYVGVIDRIAEGAADAFGGDRRNELLGIMGIAAVGSALVDNIPFTAAMIPVVDQLNEADDAAYWWALSLGACFGGNATIVAAAANVACQGIAQRNGIEMSFMRFLAWGLPVTAVSLAISAGWILAFHV